MRPVKMGERFGALWEVVEGLKPGDKVVVAGNAKDAARCACDQSKNGRPGSNASCFGCLSRKKGTLSHVSLLR